PHNWDEPPPQPGAHRPIATHQGHSGKCSGPEERRAPRLPAGPAANAYGRSQALFEISFRPLAHLAAGRQEHSAIPPKQILHRPDVAGSLWLRTSRRLPPVVPP